MSEASEASVYPGTLDTWSLVTDKEDDVEQSDINKLKNAFTSTQTELGTDVAGSATDLKTRLAVSIADTGAIRNGTSEPGSPIEGQAFWRTDTDTFEIYNGSAWSAISSVSNIVFAWRGIDGASAATGGGGFYIGGTSNTPAATASVNAFFINGLGSAGAYSDLIPSWKYTHIAGINTLTCFLRVWRDAGVAQNHTFRIDVGGQTGTVGANDTTPTWRSSFTVDVSGLTSGTTYDPKLEVQRDSTAGTSTAYCSGIVIIGS